jgi:pumilio family protein 6
MLRDAVAGDVLVETCGGGEGGVLLDAVGEEELARLHDAVAEAARKSVAGEEEDDEDEEDEEEEKKPSSGDLPGGGKKKNETRDKTKSRLPLHEDYRATRALRRMVLEIPGGACSCERAPSFARALWEGAASRDVGAWVGGHGAKVVAAVIRAGDAATRKRAMKAVEKAAGVEDAGAWAEEFFKAPGGGGNEKGTTTGQAPGKTRGGGARKGSGEGATRAGETPRAKGGKARGGAEEKPRAKSPKERSFSPRQTRAQRAKKASAA